MIVPADTTAEAFAAQALRLRKMTPSERLSEALNMCDWMRDVCAAGVRRRHPEFGEGRVSEEVGRIVLEVAPRYS
jgi:hypothetical protein